MTPNLHFGTVYSGQRVTKGLPDTMEIDRPRLRLCDDAVSWAPTEDTSVVVLDLRTSKYLGLNSSASVLWQRLAEGATEEELREALVEHFGLERDRAARDLQAFLHALRSRDLLVEI